MRPPHLLVNGKYVELDADLYRQFTGLRTAAERHTWVADLVDRMVRCAVNDPSCAGLTPHELGVEFSMMFSPLLRMEMQ